MAMSPKSHDLVDQYLLALQAHLAQDAQASLTPAAELGRLAVQMGLETLDLVQIHELAFVALMSPDHPPGGDDGAVQKAGTFFRHALVPLVDGANSSRQAGLRAKQANGKTTRAAVAALATAQKRLLREIDRRKVAEKALKESRRHHDKLLAEARVSQDQLRRLSHEILLAQEEERRHISRELHDEISQILTGINVRLAALKLEATANTGNLKKKIATTQRLVEKSVASVHRFARQLRPMMLDDLGLLPALLSFIKEFSKRTGLHIQFATVTADKIKELNSVKRTVFYRVAQEALNNVAKHARASQAKVSIEIKDGFVCMTVSDNGKAFDVARELGRKRRRGLGLLGMRERAELAGGTFAIESTPGKGTTVRIRVPLRNGVQK